MSIKFNFSIKCALFAIVFCLISFCAQSQNRYEIIENVHLNVRELPDLNSKVLGTLSSKTQIDVIEIAGNWVKFKYKDTVGYINSKYIQEITAEDKTEPEEIIAEEKNEGVTILGYTISIKNTKKAKDSSNSKKTKSTEKTANEKNSKKQDTLKDKAQTASAKNSVSTKSAVTAKNTVNNNSTGKKSTLGIDFIPNIYGGYINFLSDEASPACSVGGGIDLATRFTVNKNYFAEASLGYSLKGSAAFKLHYMNVKLTPIGYKYHLPQVALYGKLGAYAGFTGSKIETERNTFEPNLDYGVTAAIGVEYKKICIGVSYEHGIPNVCDSKLKLTNSGIYLNLAYKIFTFR